MPIEFNYSEIPIYGDIDSAHRDGTIAYSNGNLYCMCDGFWTELGSFSFTDPAKCTGTLFPNISGMELAFDHVIKDVELLFGDLRKQDQDICITKETMEEVL